MIKNKAIHAMIIGTCMFVGSMTGVYADTTAADTPVSIQIESVKTEDQVLSFDARTNKQSEIDKYVFETNAKEFSEKGITVTNTGVIGDYVEVGITPFNDENAKFIYDKFGKDLVKVVEGMQATTLDTDGAVPEYYMYMSGPAGAADDDAEPADAVVVSAPSEKETSPVASFFDNIWEWITNIF